MIDEQKLCHGLPQDLRNITFEQCEVWVQRLVKRNSTAELRRRQELQAGALHLADRTLYENSDPVIQQRIDRSICNAQIVQRILAAAVHLKEFGGDEYKAHLQYIATIS